MSFHAEPILRELKPFQRNTVEFVFDRFFGSDSVDRFLVADEVGLGKTMIARGLIAKLIEHHLDEPGRRIDVIYVCSNQAIAQQNFGKLALIGRRQRAVTDRVTTLPLHVGGLDEHAEGFDRGINVIAITPTTSLDLGRSAGRADERALLWWMLSHEDLLGHRTMSRVGGKRLLMPPVTTLESFQWYLDQVDPNKIDPGLWGNFVSECKHATLDEGMPLLEEIGALVDVFRSERKVWTGSGRERRIAAVSKLRRTLAHACVEGLEPDLVIFDEFQRFPKVFDRETETGKLAHQLFGYTGCKALLLSATPYRMYSRGHELDEDHHSDFEKTTRFLLDDDAAANALGVSMGSYRRALRSAAEDVDAVLRARDEVRRRLAKVMCRTERLGAGGDRNGMLDAAPAAPLVPVLRSTDLGAFAALDAISRRLETRDVVEFWKSTPYPLNLMESYELTRKFAKAPSRVSHRIDPLVQRAYGRIDPGNGRLRGLTERLDQEEAWKCLWLAPSLPYYAPGPPFDKHGPRTKRLVFSSWKVVPKAIAGLTSYHFDRRILHAAGMAIENSADGRKAIGQPLGWSEGGMTELLLTLPGRELAEVTDPLALSAGRGVDAPRAEVIAHAERNVRELLAALDLPPKKGKGDPAWYLVAMLRLDEAASPGSVLSFLDDLDLSTQDDKAGWTRHETRLRRALISDEDLGPVPGDLARVLAFVGIASPGCCALRAVSRRFSDGELPSRPEAARIGNALRLMLNLPEGVSLVRALASSRSRIKPREAYWRAALEYCAAGNLQAVLDEYVHVLVDWVGGETECLHLKAVAGVAAESIGINAASLQARALAEDGKEEDPIHFRSRFALRLDRGQGEDMKTIQRVDSVRKAFNSPFWPFVLTTTSIGQEGLDFHLYSHAVVHWNLPSNPVDLEQREGRVHRFKNHAVRKNLAARAGSAGFDAAPGDPWRAMFAAVPETDGGLSPYWVYPGEAAIERHVPAEPMSSDWHRLAELVRLMGIYRLAFGQPRQDELLAALSEVEGLAERADELAIDLSPPHVKA